MKESHPRYGTPLNGRVDHAQAGKALLKSEYEEGASVGDCLKLAVKVLNKTMDSTTPSPDKMEFTTITRVNGKVRGTILRGCGMFSTDLLQLVRVFFRIPRCWSVVTAASGRVEDAGGIFWSVRVMYVCLFIGV